MDVATSGSAKLIFSFCFWVIFSFVLALCTAGVVVNYQLFNPLFAFIMTPLAIFVTWFGIGVSVQRIYTLISKECYFRVGKRGISFNIFDNRLKPVMLFQYKKRQVDLTWEEIQEWYPYTLTLNHLFPISKYIFIRTRLNDRILIACSSFKESQKQIAENITYARSMGI